MTVKNSYMGKMDCLSISSSCSTYWSMFCAYQNKIIIAKFMEGGGGGGEGEREREREVCWPVTLILLIPHFAQVWNELFENCFLLFRMVETLTEQHEYSLIGLTTLQYFLPFHLVLFQTQLYYWWCIAEMNKYSLIYLKFGRKHVLK